MTCRQLSNDTTYDTEKKNPTSHDVADTSAVGPTCWEDTKTCKTDRIETYTSRFGGTFFLQPDRPCFSSEPRRDKKKQKFVTRNPGDTMGVSGYGSFFCLWAVDGRQRLWLFLLPVGSPRPFCSKARVYRAMGNAPYRRRHENRAGGGVRPNNPPLASC